MHQYASETPASCWPRSRNRYGNLIVQCDNLTYLCTYPVDNLYFSHKVRNEGIANLKNIIISDAT